MFEDGLQRRDFVAVRDVARAFAARARATTAPTGTWSTSAAGRASRCARSARGSARTIGKEIEPELTGEFRVGDIRHCYADISLARTTLGYEPEVELDAGMAELAAWLEGRVAHDRVDAAARRARLGAGSRARPA